LAAKESASVPIRIYLKRLITFLEATVESGTFLDELGFYSSMGYLESCNLKTIPKANEYSASTSDCSGDSAGELESRTRGSVSPIPKMCAIIVSCRRTRSQQRVWFSFGKASRPFGSGHNDAAREREGMLRMQTRIACPDPQSEQTVAGFKGEGGLWH
jgi:hypothetical protein